MNRIPDPRERPWLSVREVAEISGEGEKAIRSAIREGHIPALSVGRYVRIPTSALLELIGVEDLRETQDDDTVEPNGPPDLRVVNAGDDPPAA